MPITTEGGEFKVQPGDWDEPWFAGNSLVGLVVFPSPDNVEPTTRLGDQPALAYVCNMMKPFAEGQPQDQVLMAELNGVFVHVKIVDGRTQIVVADKRMG